MSNTQLLETLLFYILLHVSRHINLLWRIVGITTYHCKSYITFRTKATVEYYYLIQNIE